MRVQLSKLGVSIDQRQILTDLDFEAQENEYMVILGSSGSGKTTALRVIAGLQKPNIGEVRIDGKLMNGTAPRNRNVSMVFQKDALFPHLRLIDALRQGQPSGITAADASRQLRQVTKLTRIDGLLDRYPDQLSGGELRRAALAQAMARRSAVRMLDEPLSAIDPHLRPEMQNDLLQWHRTVPGTTIHVTHDGEEAMQLADRISVLAQGRILQCDTPEIIYQRPQHLEVATALGSPPINLLPALLDHKENLRGEGSLRGKALFASNSAPCRVLIGVRPHELTASLAEEKKLDSRTENGIQLAADLIDVRRGIQNFRITARWNGQLIHAVLADQQQVSAVQNQSIIRLRANLEHLHLFHQDTGRRIDPKTDFCRTI
ncbi:ABC transporter ATP-binding protein [bacterium]|nr:ABC transporter ATP-binding protein [bacterium]